MNIELTTLFELIIPELSNFAAISLRYQVMIVSGLTIIATSLKALIPIFLPIVARRIRSH
jgi:hypothetical protein